LLLGIKSSLGVQICVKPCAFFIQQINKTPSNNFKENTNHAHLFHAFKTQAPDVSINSRYSGYQKELKGSSMYEIEAYQVQSTKTKAKIKIFQFFFSRNKREIFFFLFLEIKGIFRNKREIYINSSPTPKRCIVLNVAKGGGTRKRSINKRTRETPLV
jgi:hypothetical protein